MKKTTLIPLSITLFILLFSCKTIISQQPTNSAQKHDLIVSFFSVAYGIDHKAKAALDIIITEDTTKGKIIIVEKTSWGREGEVDYCIDLQNYRNIDKKEFINRVKVALQPSTLVNIKEDEVCRKPVQ
jgi:hypothetical protein